MFHYLIIGTYAPFGSVQCLQCPEGAACLDATAAVTCLEGEYSGLGDHLCHQCPSGQFCAGGTAMPTACPEGTYSNNGSAVCLLCPPGIYICHDMIAHFLKLICIILFRSHVS